MLRDGPALAIGVRSGCHFRCWPSRMALFNAESAKLKTEPRAPCGKCRVQHDRNMNAVINIRFTTHLKNPKLPPGRGPMLRDGPALAIPDRRW